jgi:hypothetical protein
VATAASHSRNPQKHSSVLGKGKLQKEVLRDLRRQLEWRCLEVEREDELDEIAC